MVRTDSHQLRAGGRGPRRRRGRQGRGADAQDDDLGEDPGRCSGCGTSCASIFPAALEAFADLDAPVFLELLGKAPEPARARAADPAQVRAALNRACRWRIARAGRRDPGCAAQRAAGPQRPPVPGGRLRGHGPVADRGHHGLNEQGQVPRTAGRETILAGIWTLRLYCVPSLAWDALLGAGVLCRVRRRPAPLPRRQGQAERCRHGSPVTRAPPARRRSSQPRLPSRSTGPSTCSNAQALPAPDRLHPVPAPSTTSKEPPGMGHNDALCAFWRTCSSASSTAASRPAPSTTRTLPGPTGKTSLNLP